MTVLLDKHQVAERLGIHYKTAETLMMEMNPVAISGRTRRRYRVTEDSLEKWILRKTIGHGVVKTAGTGTDRKLKRR